MARCRVCGREQNYQNCPRINGPVGAREAARIEQACDGFTTPAEDLYGVVAGTVSFNACCDPRLGGCRCYDRRTRVDYWPAFAHPRWLSCAELYSKRI